MAADGNVDRVARPDTERTRAGGDWPGFNPVAGGQPGLIRQRLSFAPGVVR